MNIDNYRNHPDFKFLKEEILKMGIDDPFFDKDGWVGGYYLQQNSDEFAAFICFMKDLFPNGMNLYAEIGTAAGGFLRAIYELVGFKAAISIDDGKWKSDIYPLNAKHINVPIYRFIGDSHSPECRAWLEEQIANLGNPDLFFIDGDHSFHGVKQDTELAWLLTNTKLFGFHDIACERTPGVVKYFFNMHWAHARVIARFITEEKNRMGIGIVERV